jgi:hypothetical protein
MQVIQWINIYPADTVLNNWALLTKYWKSSSYSFWNMDLLSDFTKLLNHENKVKVKGHDTGGYFT